MFMHEADRKIRLNVREHLITDFKRALRNNSRNILQARTHTRTPKHFRLCVFFQ
jgi:hypothetical protein